MTTRRIPQKSVVSAYKSQTMSLSDAVGGEGGMEALIERTKYMKGDKKVVLFRMRKQSVNKGKRPAAKRKRCK
jgi:hypothetical protein